MQIRKGYGSPESLDSSCRCKCKALHFFWLYDAKINGYCLSGKLDEANKHLNSVLDCMDSIGLQVSTNVVTYNTLSNGYCKHGRIEDALTLFREMLSKGN